MNTPSITVGSNAPNEINVIIEIPVNSDPVKYEVDKNSGAIFVDRFMATTMRMGWEWLLTPLLVYQNYHLIHHLYPTVPFYKMHDVWHLKYDQLSDGNISYQRAFKMAPENMASHLSYHGR